MNQNLRTLSDKYNVISVKLAQAKGIKERIDSQLVDLKKKIDSCEIEIKNKKEAQLLLLAFIQQRRESAIQSIEKMGTHALRAIYNDDRKLVFLRNEEKKNSAAFKMEVGIESAIESDRIVTGLKDERGGGVLETTSFALRIAALEWLGYKGPLILDEAYKSMSSDEKIESVAVFLAEYVKKTGRQVIFATHKADVFEKHADHVVYVKQIDGISSATEK